jgi:hypothetical protein
MTWLQDLNAAPAEVAALDQALAEITEDEMTRDQAAADAAGEDHD